MNHPCFVRNKKLNKPGEHYGWWDTESIQEDDGTHVPNLIVYKKDKDAPVCVDGDCPKADFINHMMKYVQGYTFLAHNASGYDLRLMEKDFKMRADELPISTLEQGSRILQLKVGSNRFVTSGLASHWPKSPK